jgi:hypothetical protein
LLECSARLRQLLINFPGSDYSQYLTGFHLRSNIDKSLPNVAVCATVNRRKVDCVDASGELDLRGA